MLTVGYGCGFIAQQFHPASVCTGYPYNWSVGFVFDGKLMPAIAVDVQIMDILFAGNHCTAQVLLAHN